MYKLIDLSHEIKDNIPVFPGDCQTKLQKLREIRADGYNYSRLEIGTHTGTHIDAPSHLTEFDKNIVDYPLETFMGNGVLLDVRNENIINYKEKYENKIFSNSIVLLYTGFDEKFNKNEYFTDYPTLDLSFARILVEKEVKLIGIDTPSPDKHPFEIHKFLLQNNVPIIENLANLNKLLKVNCFEFMAFPLKINAEGSLVRAVAKFKQ